MSTRKFDDQMDLAYRDRDALEGANGEHGWSLALYPGSYYEPLGSY